MFFILRFLLNLVLFYFLQVEYYFSDENLPTDKFLLNAMKRNKKGFGEYTFFTWK